MDSTIENTEFVFPFPLNLCRLCGTLKDELESIFDDALDPVSGLSLIHLIRKCLPFLRLSSRNKGRLPPKVCHLCVNRMKEFWHFAQFAVAVQSRLEAVQRRHSDKSVETAQVYYPDVARQFVGINGISENSMAIDCDGSAAHFPFPVKFEVEFEDSPSAESGNIEHSEGPSATEIMEVENTRRVGPARTTTTLKLKLKRDATGSSEVWNGPTAVAECSDDKELQHGDCMTSDASKRSSIRSKKQTAGSPLVELQIVCLECRHLSKNYTELKAHYANAHEDKNVIGAECSMCRAPVITASKWREHKQNHQRKKFGRKRVTCLLCGKSVEQSSFKRHFERHAGIKEHVCSICSKKFCRASELKHHLKIVHEKSDSKWRFPCEFCGKGFCYAALLKAHVRIHTGEKPFECSFCGRRFAHKGNLDTHEKTHKEEKKFFCEVCGAQFHQKTSLEGHARQHTDQRPFQCSLCPKAFRRHQTLQKHQHFHFDIRPYPCSYCGKRFREKHFLANHIRIHTGERPFTCSVCGRGFVEKGNMLKHQRVHGLEIAPLLNSTPFSSPATGLNN